MTINAGLAAVLWDMDGTLLDSEPLWDTALQELAVRHGATLSDPARKSMTGRSVADSLQIFYQDLQLTRPDIPADKKFIYQRMTALFSTDLAWQPGAAELLAEVRQAELPTALVTSTIRALAEVALDSLLGADNFDVVVCGDEVTAPKPDPESYRTAAARLGVPIGGCLAIEDSPAGVASALAAGATVIGVPSDLPLHHIDGAHVVSSLAELDLAALQYLTAPGDR